MTKPADQLVRERALETDVSFIVQAPAGSGKTELLIRRFLNLLSIVAKPEEVVAITFTKKAAAEMRERIVRAIRDARSPQPPKHYDGELWSIAQKAWANNQRRNWQLERHSTRLRIQTIDALCAAITRQMPWLSGFGAPLQVIEDATELYQAAALDTVQLIASDRDDWRVAVSVLLQHLDNQLYRAVAMLTDMLRYRDQWLRHLGHAAAQKEEQKRAALQSAWLQTARRELSLIAKTVPDDVKQELVVCAAYAAAQLVRTKPDSMITAWYQSDSFVSDNPYDLPRWRGLRELLLTGKGEWRRQANVSNGFPPSKLSASESMKTKMLALLNSLSANDELRQALIQASHIPDADFTDQQWHVLSALTCLLSLAAARLNLLFGEKGQVDFSEINMRANQALGRLDSPTELALRLDCQISHLLVDEFQDTSLTQYQLIEHLTAGWIDGDGRTLFLVGDPMQSIYRFREAEVGLFLRVQQNGIGTLRPIPLTLTVNFRSDPKLVAWVNATFAASFPVAPDLSRGAVEYTVSESSVLALRDAGVSFHPLYAEAENAEAQHVVKLIQNTWSRDPQEKIAVLVRARSSLRQILPELDAAGINYSGVDIQALNWQPVVQDLLSLTCALSFPADRIAWLSILRAPWCGLTLNDLQLLTNASDQVCIWESLQSRDTITLLSSAGQKRLRRFLGPVSEAMRNRGRLSLRRCVENVWIELGGPACISEYEFDNVRVYLDLLEDYERRIGIEDFAGFNRVVIEHWAQTESQEDQRLQIMTLHKAKGLEFDTVIIPGIHRQLRPRDARLLLWEEQMERGDASLLLAPLAEVGPFNDPHYDYLRTVHAEKEHFETLRLLYVGCTRARRRVHLTGVLHTGKGGKIIRPRSHSFLAKLWSRLGAEFDRPQSKQFELFGVRLPMPDDAALQRLPLDWQNIFPDSVPFEQGTADTEPPAEDIEFSWAGETARHIGIFVHDMLERMAREGIDKWNRQRLCELRPGWRTQLVSLGASRETADSATAHVFEALCNVLHDERALWILASDHDHAKSECALSYAHSGRIKHLRVDRTFVDQQGIRWIIDFKSSAHEGGRLDDFLNREQHRYRDQLASYAQAFAALEERQIMLGLYFPLLRGWREWEYVKT